MSAFSDSLRPSDIIVSTDEESRACMVEAIASDIATLRPLDRLTIEVKEDGNYTVTFTSPTPAY